MTIVKQVIYFVKYSILSKIFQNSVILLNNSFTKLSENVFLLK